MDSSRGKRYTEQERERGLLALAVHGGSYAKASRYLTETGHTMSPDTLKGFKRNFPDRYHQIMKDAAPKVREIIAAEAEALALKLTEVEWEALHKTQESLPSLDPRDLGRTLQYLTKSKSTQIEKAALLRGMPTEIHEKRSPDEIFNSIRQKLGDVIDSSAEELPVPEIEGK